MLDAVSTQVYLDTQSYMDFDRIYKSFCKSLDKVRAKFAVKSTGTIYAISGPKMNGKDTFANLLIQHDPSFTKLSFAKPLKDMCQRIFDLTDEQVNDEVAKERFFSQDDKHPVQIDHYLAQLNAATGLFLKAANKLAYTPRQILQYVGTDYVRAAQDDYWVQALLKQIEPGKNYVIADCRFPNEALALRNVGATIIRLVRLAKPTRGAPEHASEKLDFEGDVTLAVMEHNWTLPTLIVQRSVTGNMQSLLKTYDWNRLRKNLTKEKPGCCEHHTPMGAFQFNAWLYYGDTLTASLPECDGVALRS